MPWLGLFAALLLAACVSTGITGYSHQDPGGVYPAGEVSGPPTRFVGWKLKW